MRSLAIVLARSASAKRVPHIGPSPDTLPPSRVVIPRSARTARSLARLWHLVCQPPTRLSLLKPEPVVSIFVHGIRGSSNRKDNAQGTRVTSQHASQSRSVSSYFTVPLRAHPSTGSQSARARNRSWRNVYRLLLRTHSSLDIAAFVQ